MITPLQDEMSRFYSSGVKNFPATASSYTDSVAVTRTAIRSIPYFFPLYSMKTILAKATVVALLILSPFSVAAAGADASARGSDKLLVVIDARDAQIGFVRTAVVASKTRAPATKLIVPLARAKAKTTTKKQATSVGVARQTTQPRVSAREFRRQYFERLAAKTSN